MGTSGISASSGDMQQQVQLSMLAAALNQQQSMMASMEASSQAIDLSFVGKGLHIDVQA